MFFLKIIYRGCLFGALARIVPILNVPFLSSRCGSLFFFALSAGDFCTLVRAGYSTRQAIAAQLLTAVAAVAGTATAIAVSHEAWAEERLLWGTAGGFLYLAGTTILPQVLADDGRSQNLTRTSRRCLRMAQFAAFCSGILLLSVVDVLGGEHHHVDHGHEHDHGHAVASRNDNHRAHHKHAEL